MATTKSVATRKQIAAAADLTVQELVGRMQRIQQVMKKTMKDKVHYGVVPGTDKPSLWKAGAEKLCTVFRIAPSYRVDNISDEDHYEFIVTCDGTHQETGKLLGAGLGSASSNEEKYKWRAALSDEEFESIDDDRKRTKFKKVWRNREQFIEPVDQIRTEPADQVNTILKMAAKRAFIAMVINVLAASDIFNQDLEDLPEGTDTTDTGGNGGGGQQRTNTRPPQSTGGGVGGVISQAQKGLLVRKLGDAGIDGRLLCEHFKIEAINVLPRGSMDAALAWIQGSNKGGNASG